MTGYTESLMSRVVRISRRWLVLRAIITHWHIGATDSLQLKQIYKKFLFTCLILRTVQLSPAVVCGVRVAQAVDSKEAIVTSLLAPVCT